MTQVISLIRCTKCGDPKASDQFALDRRGSTGHQNWCKACSNARRRERYRQNRGGEYRTNEGCRRLRKLENYRRMWAYFRLHPCVDCGETEPVVLQSDHVRGTKCYDLSWMLHRGMAWTKILEELEKCDTRCANCHQRKTARDRGWYAFIEEDVSMAHSFTG